MRPLRSVWPLLTLLLIVVLWLTLTAADSSTARVIPTPGDVWAAFVRNRQTLLTLHIPTTLLETLIGLLLALLLGVGLALLLDWSPLARQMLFPLLVVSQTIPTIALAPVLILIFGFGIEPKVTVVVLFCVFPIMVNTLEGLTATSPDAVLLLRSLGADRWQTWRKARWPSALPGLFSGLRIAATYSVAGAIVGEYVSSNAGIGQYMRLAYASAHLDQVFVAIVITALLSLALVALVTAVERLIIPWHYAHLQTGQWNPSATGLD